MDDRQKDSKVVVTFDSYPKKAGRLLFKVFCESMQPMEFRIIDGILTFDETNETFRQLAHDAIFHASMRAEELNWVPLSYDIECKYNDD